MDSSKNFLKILLVGLALTMPYAYATDDYAAAIAGSAGTVGDVTNALGEPDDTNAGYVNLPLDSWVTVNFDHYCFETGDGPADITVYEYLGTEPFTVAVGMQGGSLSDPVAGYGNNGEMVDLSAVASGAIFNQAMIISTSNGGVVPGLELDAVECLSSFVASDITGDISKMFVYNPLDGNDNTEMKNIYIREKDDDTLQHKAFSITIANNSGLGDAWAGLIFTDAVPAEFDLDAAAEAFMDGVTDNDNDGDFDDEEDCDDGAKCNGIVIVVTDDTVSGDVPTCDVEASRTNGAMKGKNAGKKLEPELLNITTTLAADDSCTITVYVVTDKADHKKSATPTSCDVELNSGVKVFDGLMNFLFLDDDQLIFSDGSGDNGWCGDEPDDDDDDGGGLVVR
ncbi:hypothetical protein [Colwellia sp. TT2012]|uniref:hypothetical protein n=1 Tax=Colwellia sp. TT2012 TaxID=1720342 RepID=UPI00070BEB64|nr:hypothetical protein [Colwellia sp. TT2012]